ncbi:MAG: guanylate kinase [Dehalococcoidia bacterium]
MTAVTTANPLLIVLTGPSGVGKDAIVSRMKEREMPFFYAVTATSRSQRPGEIDGIDYYFIDRSEFERMIDNDEFLEWANVYGNLYGVPRKTVEQAMAKGKDAVVKVDIQGAATIKKIEPEAITIFIAPPSMEELARRLKERKTESETDIDLRLKTAQNEMDSRDSFDYVVVSPKNEIDKAISEIMSIINEEKKRVSQRAGDTEQQRKRREAAKGKTVDRLTPGRAGDEVIRIQRNPRRGFRLPLFLRKIRSRMKGKK